MFCLEGVESSEHLLCQCIDLTTLRSRGVGQPILKQESITDVVVAGQENIADVVVADVVVVGIIDGIIVGQKIIADVVAGVKLAAINV